MITIKDVGQPEPIANFIDSFTPIENSSGKDDYNQYQRPPDLQLAKKHGLANRYAETVASDLDPYKCPCCGKPSNLKELSLCSSTKRFSLNGPGIAMYFDFLVFCISILLIYGVLASGFNIWQNYEGRLCERTPSYCSNTVFNQFALSNRTSRENLVGAILNFLASISIMVATLIYRKKINILEIQIDDSEIAVQDFSIMVRNLPIDATETEIQKFFEDIETEGKKLEVKKICMGFNIDPINQINQLIDKKIKQLFVMEKYSSKQKENHDYQLQKEILESEIDLLYQQLYALLENSNLLAFSGVCFVSFNTEEQADYAIQQHDVSEIQIIIMKILKMLKVSRGRLFRDELISAIKAPEPGDILWENLGITYQELTRNRVITTFASAFVLAVCFGFILGISLTQIKLLQNSRKNESADGLIQALGTGASVLVVLINNVLGFVMRKFARFEKDSSKTEFNISIAKKLGLAQFANTAIITLIVNIMVKDDSKPFIEQMVKSGGLNQNVGLIIMANAMFAGVTLLFHPTHIYKLVMRKLLEFQIISHRFTQKEANEIFEGTEIDLADKYAQVTKTIMLTFFYAYLLPLGVIIGILGLIVQYWIEKIMLLRRDKQPPPVGTTLAEEMVGFQIEVTIIMLAAGCCVWENFVYDEMRTITLVQLILSLLYWVLPMELVFAKCLKVESNATPQTYEQSRHLFWDDYDRRNPVTREKALEAWLKQEGVRQNGKNQIYTVAKLSTGVKSWIEKSKIRSTSLATNTSGILGQLQQLTSQETTHQNLSMKIRKDKSFLTPKNETRLTLIGKGEQYSPSGKVYPQDLDDEQYSISNFSMRKPKIIPRESDEIHSLQPMPQRAKVEQNIPDLDEIEEIDINPRDSQTR